MPLSNVRASNSICIASDLQASYLAATGAFYRPISLSAQMIAYLLIGYTSLRVSIIRFVNTILEINAI